MMFGVRTLSQRVNGACALSPRVLLLLRGVSSLVIAEHDNTILNENTLNSVTAAVKVGGPISILVIGSQCGNVASAASKIAGVSSVIVADHPALKDRLCEVSASVAKTATYVHSFSHVVATSSSFGKSMLSRLGALLDVQPISEVIKVIDADTFVRPTYAGNAITTVKSSDKIKVLSVRPTLFPKSAATGGNATTSLLDVAAAISSTGSVSTFISRATMKSERPELGDARVVVSGGRGVGSKANFALIESLADALGGAVGASRAAVDAGFAPNDLQVGQTGKVVAPDLYIAVGISGAIQHLAGMKDSKVIVAINKDGDAPIFEVSDYGLVDDLFKVVPEMTAALKKG